MNTNSSSAAAAAQPPLAAGLASAVTAYLIWGLTPIYFKSLAMVPPFEILMHRIVWSFALLLPLMAITHRWPYFVNALKSPRLLLILMVSTLLVGTNWFLFIYAINTNRILQTSLGYYINPLVNVLLGMIFLGERLRRLQVLAVALAVVGVGYLTLYYGTFPGIALALAFSFAFYALVRKLAPVAAIEGLAVETLLLSVPALAFLMYLNQQGTGAIFRLGPRVDLLLMGTAAATAVPLLLFTFGARILKLTTIGFLQYIAPSCTFLLAVFIYHEPFRQAQLISFGLIWTALAIFSFDAFRYQQRRHRALAPV